MAEQASFSPEQLSAYDGSDAGKPVYISVKGIVYDVSAAREFYGKGGPYEVFAGRECSRALAIMKVDASECNDNLADISEKQQKTLDDWIAKFTSKYKVVGKLAPSSSSSGHQPGKAAPAAGAAAAPHGEGASEEDVQELMELAGPNRLPTELLVLGVVLVVLTLVGAYILFMDMNSAQAPKEEL